ncbi:hypothetical protein Q4595_09275 [Wenyingzhuangia sp. 1_MG-2023]|nr:hypothetical protein [Wenyingzhuangia sp. 1_MG-2023]
MDNVKELFKQHYFFVIGAFVSIVVFLATYKIPFFWDAISKSERATWFFEHHFSQWVIPTELNSGHPPLWTLLLAFSWTLFGRTLLVSRALLLLLNLAVVYQMQLLVKKYSDNGIPKYAYLLLLIEPTYLAQSTILNNDVLLLLMCFLAFNNIFKNRVIYSLALTGILFCNLRGILFFGGFVLFDVLVQVFGWIKVKNYKKSIYALVVPLLCFGTFLVYQYHQLGWVFKSPSKNWSDQRELVGVFQLLKNGISLVWVFADFGRFLFWILALLSGVVCIQKKIQINVKIKRLILFWICLLVCNVTMIFSSNPIGHRYFMFLYLIGLLITLHLIFTVFSTKKAKLASFSIGILLISGHFWIYPETISQGWDSSLAYLSYFEVKEKMYHYVLEQNLPVTEVGTKTRNPSVYIAYLRNEEQETYTYCSKISEVEYFVHSNIENSTKDEEIAILHNQWVLLQEYQKGGVFIRLYQAPKLN